MSDEGLQALVDAWRQRFAAGERRRAAAAQKARALLPVLCRHLVERYGVRRVWLFGSLVEGGFAEGSDIDLAVEDFPPGPELFRAGAELDDLARPFVVDLVPLEQAREPLRRKVLDKGELLHGTR